MIQEEAELVDMEVLRKRDPSTGKGSITRLIPVEIGWSMLPLLAGSGSLESRRLAAARPCPVSWPATPSGGCSGRKSLKVELVGPVVPDRRGEHNPPREDMGLAVELGTALTA